MFEAMPSHAFTIGKLADVANVTVETIRYYQRRGLIKEPLKKTGGFRSYDENHVQRLQFIKRAQELGFSLNDIEELLSLSQGINRERLREIIRIRLADIQQKIIQLESIASALKGLADCCKQTKLDDPCPIIAALAGEQLQEKPIIKKRISTKSKKTISHV